MTRIRLQNGKALWWLLLVAAIAAGAVYYFYFLGRKEAPDVALPSRAELSEPPAAAAPAAEPELAPPTATILEEPIAEVEPLPALPESDDEALETAQALLGEDPVKTYLVTEGVIPKLVAAVDALTAGELPKNILPLRGPGGEFETTEDGVGQPVNPQTGLPEPRYRLDPANFRRYTGHVEAFEAIDAAALAEQYRKYYPLLQQSYRELGYPQGEFNDRLLQVIDHLLATPEPERPVHLVKPEAFYEFADPALEGLSAGQKVLIRIGPSNAARVRAKLSEIRAALQTQRE